MERMPHIPSPHTPLIRNLFFWSGIAATVLYRAIIVMNHVPGPWAKIFWYAGTVGFVLYFAHRYQISERRAKVIADCALLDKVRVSGMPDDDKAAFEYVLGTLQSSKEKWNFITIFATSALAILVGIYLDFLR